MPIQTIIVRLATPISSGAVHAIDLGLVSLRDAAINGRNVPLIPYKEGRVISSVRFLPSVAFNAPDADIIFTTPNNRTFMAVVGSVGAIDAFGLIESSDNTTIFGDNASPSQIIDTGPLLAGTPDSYLYPADDWLPDNPYTISEFTTDGDYLFIVSVNGVSGNVRPAFGPGNTMDGTVTWTRYGLLPSGSVHVIAEVIDGVSPMPPYPATLEWVSQPVNTPSGDPIPDMVVSVKDQNGSAYKFSPIEFALWIVGAGTLTNGDANMDTSTGLVTFAGCSIAETGTGYILKVAQLPGLAADPIFSDPFNIT